MILMYDNFGSLGSMLKRMKPYGYTEQDVMMLIDQLNLAVVQNSQAERKMKVYYSTNGLYK